MKVLLFLLCFSSAVHAETVKEYVDRRDKEIQEEIDNIRKEGQKKRDQLTIDFLKAFVLRRGIVCEKITDHYRNESNKSLSFKCDEKKYLIIPDYDNHDNKDGILLEDDR